MKDGLSIYWLVGLILNGIGALALTIFMFWVKNLKEEFKTFGAEIKDMTKDHNSEFKELATMIAVISTDHDNTKKKLSEVEIMSRKEATRVEAKIDAFHNLLDRDKKEIVEEMRGRHHKSMNEIQKLHIHFAKRSREGVQ